MVNGQEVTIITQARVGSSRLPRKVLKTIDGKSLLEIHLERIKRSKLADRVIVATTTEPEAHEIVKIAEASGLTAYRGSIDDVLDRFYQTAAAAPPHYVVRLTSDCPLLDPDLIDAVILAAVEGNYDYVANIFEEDFPDGQDIEVFTYAALKTAWEQAKLTSEREHVTPFIRKHSDYNEGTLFKARHYGLSTKYAHIRMTVDEADDFTMLERLVRELGIEEDWQTYARYIVENSEQFSNQCIIRNEGYLKSLQQDNKEDE